MADLSSKSPSDSLKAVFFIFIHIFHSLVVWELFVFEVSDSSLPSFVDMVVPRDCPTYITVDSKTFKQGKLIFVKVLIKYFSLNYFTGFNINEAFRKIHKRLSVNLRAGRNQDATLYRQTVQEIVIQV